MRYHKKLWPNLSAITFTFVFLLGGCSEDINKRDIQNPPLDKQERKAQPIESVEIKENELDYLTQLGLMRGHLLVGRELYHAGHIEHAKMHMKHPESELYEVIRPALDKRGSKGFANELQALAVSVESEEGIEAVDIAYASAVSAIGQSENLVSEEHTNLEAKLNLAAAILMIAAEEYDIAVVDGEMQNAHEYQDAYGFTHIAEAIVDGAEKHSARDEMLMVKVAAIFSELQQLWPSLIPPAKLKTDASQLYDAAAQVALLASDQN